MTIKRQLNLYYAAVFFALAGAIVAGVSLVSYRVLFAQSNAAMSALVTNSRNLLDIDFANVVKNYLKGIAERDRDLVSFYYLLARTGRLDEDEAKRLATSALLAQKIGNSGYVYCIDSTGVVRVHPDASLVGTDLSSYDFVKQQLAAKKGYLEYDWTNPGETASRAKALYMDYFAPWDWIISVSSYRSEFIDLVDLGDYTQGLLEARIGTTGYLFLMDYQGKLLVHPTMQGQNIADSRDGKGRYYAREMIANKDGVIRYLWKNPGEKAEREKIVYYRSIPELGVIVAGGTYVDELAAASRSGLLLAALIFVLGLGALFLVGNAVAGHFSRPLSSVKELVEAVGHGDLTARASSAEEERTLGREDEIGDMARAAFEMQGRLRGLTSSVRAASKAIRGGADEIGFSIDAQAAAASQMSASVAEITSTTEELSASSTQIAEHSRSVVDIANLTWENSKRGSESMGVLRDRIEAIRSDNEQSLAEIVELGRKSKEISKVMAIINNVADQTKLIAFNAALEAASAGEAGRRFGVVAAEIRRLADSVTQSTGEIETRVAEIQDSIARLVITSEKRATGIDQGMEATAAADALLGELVGAASRTSDAARQISLSTQQQRTASGQVVVALREIVSASQHTATSIAKIAEISHAMSASSAELDGLVGSFRLDRDA